MQHMKQQIKKSNTFWSSLHLFLNFSVAFFSHFKANGCYGFLMLSFFLAAKAQLNTCTFLLSVRPFVLNLNFSLFDPYLTAYDSL